MGTQQPKGGDPVTREFNRPQAATVKSDLSAEGVRMSSGQAMAEKPGI
jgi:hypothetical protein